VISAHELRSNYSKEAVQRTLLLNFLDDLQKKVIDTQKRGHTSCEFATLYWMYCHQELCEAAVPKLQKLGYDVNKKQYPSGYSTYRLSWDAE
jgi:hypothetical protein